MNEIIAKLTDAGWREFPDILHETARCFFKRYETPTRCRCNDDKWGMQVCLRVYPPYKHFGGIFELELSGELPDGTWIGLHSWAMPSDLDKCLATIPRLLDTWEYIVNRGEE